MVTEAQLGIYITISFATSLVFNFICYRLIFRKMKRMRANAFSWLLTLFIVLGANFGYLYIFIPNMLYNFLFLDRLDQVLALIIAPITWFVFPSLLTMFRAIFIRLSRKREREVLSKDIEAAELLSSNEPFIDNSR
ncbi:MAG: hypothetical protein FK733_17570 [Asgard group archaeon]|nr:hypothetical protein [Asgard group archaeon]